jgi:outer membrane protein TolC
LAGGLYAAGPNSSFGQATSRSDINLQIFWEFQNLGFGNRGRVTEARGEQMRAMVELFRVQDRIAEEVAQAHAEVEAATTEMAKAEAGLRAAQISYAGNFRGLSETIRQGDILVLVSRPLDAVAALLQLQQAYSNYYVAVNQYNRAQFRLFRALGYPAHLIACNDAIGPIQPVDTSRPAPLPSVPDR